MNNILCIPKNAFECSSLYYDFVLICVNQHHVAAAITPGVLLRACSWMLPVSIAKCCLLLVCGLVCFSFTWLVAISRLSMWVVSITRKI